MMLFVVFVCEGISQQHYDTKYDIYEDIPEIWTVGWSSCQYNLWSRLLFRSGVNQSKLHLQLL